MTLKLNLWALCKSIKKKKNPNSIRVKKVRSDKKIKGKKEEKMNASQVIRQRCRKT